MKRVSVALLIIVACAGLSRANPAIFLQASIAKKAEKAKDRFGDTDRIQHQTIDIVVRNLRTQPEEVTVKWLFVAKSEQNRKLWTYSQGDEAITLNGGQGTNITATSEKLVAKSYDIYFGTNSKPNAYVVVVLQGEDIIKCVASSQPLQVKCSTKEGFEEMQNSKPPEE